MKRIFLRWYYRFCLRWLNDELAEWQAIGLIPGARYLINCEDQARHLRNRISMLESGYEAA